MIRTMNGFVLVCCFTVGCASGFNRGGQTGAARGTITVSDRNTRVVLRGPAVVHAYASTSAARLFSAPLIVGNDEDCRAQLASREQADVTSGGADYARLTLTVQPGEVLCITSARSRTEELLWHVHPVVHGGSATAGWRDAEVPAARAQPLLAPGLRPTSAIKSK